jgi:histidine kinase/DNA gyrase B/HSP90-like ATPase
LPTTGIVAAVAGWSVGYARLLTRRPRPWWLLPVDVAIVAAACLTQRWTVPAEAVTSNQGWVIALASISVVAYQWHTALPTGVAAVVAVDVAFAGGTMLVVPGGLGAAAFMIAWLPVEATLSRLLWILLRRGGRRADGITAQAERASRTEAVARAARADERAFMASLHDNAASTLLMVGLSDVTADDPWLRAQAGSDLASLDRWSAAEGAAEDVVPLLRAVIAASRVAVTAELPGSLTLPGPVCVAVCGSVREALANVARHAGTGRANVKLERQDGRVAVLVDDDGVGFVPETVPPGRFGVSGSILGRMAGVGGHAEVTSTPGRGTTVHLEWSP